MTKQKAMSVYIDDETTLVLNRLREEIRQRYEREGIPGNAPPLAGLPVPCCVKNWGWLLQKTTRPVRSKAGLQWKYHCMNR
ncbi:TPA: hypothetical protein ACNUZQ_002990 [Citrobacter braakii]